jgi:hypothetical protein
MLNLLVEKINEKAKESVLFAKNDTLRENAVTVQQEEDADIVVLSNIEEDNLFRKS